MTTFVGQLSETTGWKNKKTQRPENITHFTLFTFSCPHNRDLYCFTLQNTRDNENQKWVREMKREMDGDSVVRTHFFVDSFQLISDEEK